MHSRKLSNLWNNLGSLKCPQGHNSCIITSGNDPPLFLSNNQWDSISIPANLHMIPWKLVSDKPNIT